MYARNKKSITLDLKAPEAPGIILDLAAHFDVLVEGFRYRYLEKLGVGPDTLMERNPRLVVVRVSGFGQTGPYARRPGFGTLVEAMSGFASRNGFAVVTLEKPADGLDANLLYMQAAGRSPQMPQGLPLLKPPYSRVTAIDRRWVTSCQWRSMKTKATTA